MKERPQADPVLQALQAMVDSECRRCGKCCLNSHPISVKDHEVWRIAARLKRPTSEIREQFFTRNSDRRLIMREPCPFLSDKGCTIYEVRPQVCRDFPFLSDVSRSAFALSSTIIGTQYCPASAEAINSLKEVIEKQTGVAPKETRGEIDAHTIEDELAEIRRQDRRRA